MNKKIFLSLLCFEALVLGNSVAAPSSFSGGAVVSHDKAYYTSTL